MKYLFLAFTLIYNNVDAQNVFRPPSLDFYGQNINLAFHEYGYWDIYAFFRVDTTGSVIDLSINTDYFVPENVKGHIKELINYSNGKWLPQISSCNYEISDSIFICFRVICCSGEDITNIEGKRIWNSLNLDQDTTETRITYEFQKKWSTSMPIHPRKNERYKKYGYLVAFFFYP